VLYTSDVNRYTYGYFHRSIFKTVHYVFIVFGWQKGKCKAVCWSYITIPFILHQLQNELCYTLESKLDTSIIRTQLMNIWYDKLKSLTYESLSIWTNWILYIIIWIYMHWQKSLENLKKKTEKFSYDFCQCGSQKVYVIM